MDGVYVGETRYNANGSVSLYIRYILDEAKSPVGISLWYPGDGQWTDYHFIKNLQGDVLEVFKVSDGSLAASYTYDSWGNILSKSGTLADINPFRYRGYYYDTETWFYYLQSRYYDPAIGRFINEDALVSTGQGVLGYNMFAYCNNNPVNYCDTNGYALEAILVDGAIAGVVSLLNAAVFGATGTELLNAFADGFLQGVICSATSGFGFGNVIKYAIILYDVGSAVYECWESGASTEECVLVALVQLWAAFSFDNVDMDQFSDLVFGLGTTLCASGITEGVQRHNSTDANTLPGYSQQSNGQGSSAPSYLGEKGGCGSAVVCCMK